MSTEATPDIDAQEEVPGYKAPEKKDLKDIVSCYFVPCHFKQIHLCMLNKYIQCNVQVYVDSIFMGFLCPIFLLLCHT